MKCPVCDRDIQMMAYWPLCCGLCQDVQQGRKTLEEAEAARGTYTRERR